MTADNANTEPSMPWRSDAIERARHLENRGNNALCPLLLRLYKWRRARPLVLRLCQWIEGKLMFSKSWRHILSHYHGIEIGAYSYGDVLRPGVLPAGTIVGRYCSVGKDLIVRRRDHPVERRIMHPAFYNHRIGLLTHDTIPGNRDNPLMIGHDVWIGDRVLILSGCKTIGNGAVIAAGCVVTRDVSAYAVMGGVPARMIRMRFNEEQIAEIEASAWWERSLPDLVAASLETSLGIEV
jgi:acetyltransferase-like isoleucine patch superfamily enzyme